MKKGLSLTHTEVLQCPHYGAKQYSSWNSDLHMAVQVCRKLNNRVALHLLQFKGQSVFLGLRACPRVHQHKPVVSPEPSAGALSRARSLAAGDCMQFGCWQQQQT